jgi:hypothetical protein
MVGNYSQLASTTRSGAPLVLLYTQLDTLDGNAETTMSSICRAERPS